MAALKVKEIEVRRSDTNSVEAFVRQAQALTDLQTGQISKSVSFPSSD